MTRRDFLAVSATINITPTDQDGVSHVVAFEVDEAPPPSEEGEWITTPEEHGWQASNSVEENSDALREAVAKASGNASRSSSGRGVVELTPGATYTVRPAGDANGSRDRPTGAIEIDNRFRNVELRTRGKPPLGSADQAMLRMESWAGKSGMHNRAIISIDSGRNLLFGWLTLDGHKFSIGGNANLSRINSRQGDNGGLHCIAIQGCDGVVFRHVEAFNALTDAMRLDKEHAIGTGHVTGDLCRGLTVEDCDLHHSRRQALSIISAGDRAGPYDQVVFRRTKFRFTGDDGSLAGEAPGSNIDIEPNNANDLVHGITFEDCDSEDAKGSTYEHGAPRGRTAGRGFVMDGRAGHICTKMRFRNFRVLRSAGSEGFAFVLYARDGARLDDWEIANLVAKGNKGDRIHFNASGTGARFTRFRISSFDGDLVYLATNVPATGHSIEILKGSFNPTITTNGRSVVSVRD